MHKTLRVFVLMSLCVFLINACAQPLGNQELTLNNSLSEPEAIPSTNQLSDDSSEGISPFSEPAPSASLIDETKILTALPPDGIPSIDSPIFTSVEEADKWLEEDSEVFVVTHKNVTRVYPQRIMVWHEIVNDNIGGDPMLITYCPLCGSVIAFERTVDGKVVEFGTSGKLYNSALVMYDRLTKSLWTQVKGQAVKGKHAGKILKTHSIDVVKWGDWKKTHPESEVLAKDTVNPRPYDRDPYGDYYWLNRLMFPVEPTDDRLHGKTIVHGIEVNGKYKAYKQDDLVGGINDVFQGVNIHAEITDDGRVRFTNTDTGEEIIKERDFWFCFFAYHPTTKLYEKV